MTACLFTRRGIIACLSTLPPGARPMPPVRAAAVVAGARRAGPHRPVRLPGQREVRRRACLLGRPQAAFRSGLPMAAPRWFIQQSPRRWTASCGWAVARSSGCRHRQATASRRFAVAGVALHGLRSASCAGSFVERRAHSGRSCSKRHATSGGGGEATLACRRRCAAADATARRRRGADAASPMHPITPGAAARC